MRFLSIHPWRALLVLTVLGWTLGCGPADEPAVPVPDSSLDGPAFAAELAGVEELILDARYAAAESRGRDLLGRAREAFGEESLEAAETMQRTAEAMRRGKKTRDPEALELAQGAVRIKEGLLDENDPELAEATHQLGMLHYKLRSYVQADEHLLRALKMREASLGERHPAVAHSVMTWGGLLRADTVEEAIELLERARSIQEECLEADHPDVAQRMMYLGYVRFWLEEHDSAIEQYAGALEILEARLRPDHPRLGTVHQNLGKLAHATGDLAGARPHLERVLPIFEDTFGADHPHVATSLMDLADLDVAMGAGEDALEGYERALGILQTTFGDRHHRVAECSLRLGFLRRHRREYADARRHYERALEFVENGEADDALVAQCAFQYGALLHETGDFDGAEARYETARSALERGGGPASDGLAMVVYNMGILAFDRGEIERACELIESSIERFGRLGDSEQVPILAEARVGLSMALYADGQRDAALEQALLAERVARDHLRLTSTRTIRQRALRYAEGRTSGLDFAFSLVLGGGLSGPESTVAVLREAIGSRALILEEMATRQQAMCRAVEPGLARSAGELRSTAAELSDLLVRGPGSASTGAWMHDLEEVNQRKVRAERDFAEESHEFRGMGERSEPSLEEIAAALPARSALVSIFHFGRHLSPEEPTKVDSYVASVLRSDDPQPIAVPLGSAEEVHDLILRWRQLVTRGSVPEARVREAGVALRRRIWDSIAEHLDGVGMVLVVPDQALHLVNLAALPVGEEGYLLESGPLIHYLSTERGLLDDRSGLERGAGLLALGGAAFGDLAPAEAPESGERIPPLARSFRSLSFEDLPGSADEARYIASQWEAGAEEDGTALLLLRKRATEAAFKKEAPRRRVLHLATHGFFLGAEPEPVEVASARGGMNPKIPKGEPLVDVLEPRAELPMPGPDDHPLLCSGLALAGANRRAEAKPGEEDGILTAEEIVMLDLSRVELAVLSACDTGLGQVQAGEGVFGLRRAFELAGVETVIMSLWKVDDRAAEQWMKHFHSSWRGRGESIPEAVRAASLATREERRERGQSTHPSYWAAFVAVGGWR